MRSYRNKKGEVITVDEGHLQTALEIKKFLQKNNNRCSWAQHKKMMVEEGYNDSESSEAYRQMIKAYQSSIDELPSAQSYAEMVTENKLESVRNLVGELAWEKREMQKTLRELNRGKRELIDEGLFINEIKSEIRNVLSDVKWQEVLNHTFEPVAKSSGTRMILVLTDWHIGAMVDIDSNKYNFEVAKRRIHEAVDKAIQIATERKVYRIDVVYMGDILEHAYMRDSQAYSAEFPVSKQMVLGGRLMIEVLYKISRTFFTTFRAFSGNHDRFNKDKNGNIDGDSGIVVVNEMVQLFIEQSNIENLMYVECHNYHAKLINVNGRNFRFEHGDLLKASDKGKLADRSSQDGIVYDAIVYGHFHHFMVLEVGLDRFEVRVGSTKGSDDYSEKLGLGSAPSQAVILVGKDGEIDVKRLRLH